jgi:N-ethylmaleimide reductase
MEQFDTSALYSPLQLGAARLKHRVIMAPLTRSRSLQPGSIPGDLMVEYYGQRASDGGFIIGEATNVSLTGRGWFGSPGLYCQDQVVGWRKVVDAVHAKDGIMFAQLWHTGRVSHVELTGGQTPVTASFDASFWENPKQLSSTPAGWIQPSPHRALELSEIPAVIEDYRRAAEAAKQAGFDGVELHGANGYLIDQFLQNGSNKRTDLYGGPIENRIRLALEVIEAMVSVWGGSRVGMRIGPEGTFNAMSDSDSVSLFDHLADALNPFGLAYLHIIEPRVRGNVVIHENQRPIASERLRRVFKGRLIGAGGFEPSSANSAIKEGILDAVAFGRYFVSNPDLPQRIQEHWPLAAYDRQTFYTFDAKGYTDYPAYQEAAGR